MRDVVDAVDGAAVDGLLDEVVAVARLIVHPRPPMLLLHEEGAPRSRRAERAADARVLVHVGETGLQRLARLVVELQVHV